MEEGLSEEKPFSDIDLDSSQSQYGKYLDSICPYYMSWGMTWDEFWHESLDRLQAYWQANQFNIERRNQELWLQGLYIRTAVASCLDKKFKYPEKPQRITEMTEDEQAAADRRKIEQMRTVLAERKRRWDAKHKGVEAANDR